MKEESKAFFFAKKKQKTFVSFAIAGASMFPEALEALTQAKGVKVFCFFFPKKKALLSSCAR